LYISADGSERDIPFIIMTSDDTHSRTLDLLELNSYFGMKPTQVHLLKQVKDHLLSFLDRFYENVKCFEK